MMDKILYEGKWISVIERDGWYQFSRGTTSDGVVYILVFRKNSRTPVLGRYEICPAHGDKSPVLTSITGGVKAGRNPAAVAIEEIKEEAGYTVCQTDLVDLGKTNLTKSCDTIGHLYAVDVTGLPRGDALGDGSEGEKESYCDWVSFGSTVLCKCPVMCTLVARLCIVHGAYSPDILRPSDFAL